MAEQSDKRSTEPKTPAELLALAGELGLSPDKDTDPAELAAMIAARQELVARIDRQTLVELMEWGHRRVRPSARKAELVAQVCRIRKMRFDDLSADAMRALAELRGVAVGPDDEPEQIAHTMKATEGLRHKLGRKRRSLVGKLVAMLAGEAPEQPDPNRPEEGPRPSLKEQIEDRGLVGGLADKLRGTADDYIAFKLDEIEHRIDRKLDDIDRRLAEWRDREISNRLRIIKITLTVSVIVALLSVAMAWMKKTFGW